MDVRVGLDFGTHQTKVCVNYQNQGQVPIYEFINFGESGNYNFFLPSKVNIYEDNSISVGSSMKEPVHSFQYFKMASAEDESFRGISGLEISKDHYDIDRYKGTSPEIISIIYLIHTIGFVLHQFEKKQSKKTQKPKKKSFLSSFLGSDDSVEELVENNNYYYQIGIPTEWSTKKNYWRRRKFEQILYLAVEIVQELEYDQIQNFKLPELLDVIQIKFDKLISTIKQSNWSTIIDNSTISAFPEAAAGLTYLVKTGKISEGYYLTLDIGGGSSDISFFRVNPNRTFEYLASESLLIASNDLFNTYNKITNSNLSLEKVHNSLGMKSQNLLQKDHSFQKACEETIDRLSKKIKYIYNDRVYRRFAKTVANSKFKDQSCYLYGGGSLLFDIKKGSKKLLGKILLHDQGTMSLTAARTFATVDPIREMDIPHLIKPSEWTKELPLLIVALGLSFIQPDKTFDWNDDFYKSGEGLNIYDENVEYFDIYRRKWV